MACLFAATVRRLQLRCCFALSEIAGQTESLVAMLIVASAICCPSMLLNNRRIYESLFERWPI